jgi:putative endonuclease
LSGPRPSRQQAERRGRVSEAVAALSLRLKGYRILARRYKTPVGEIDLVARRGRIIAFVEVKARASEGAGLEAVTPFGSGRIARAAEAYLMRYPAAAVFHLRFDVIVVRPWRWPAHLTGAFGEGGRA